jgi:hypothetical protein
VRVVSVPEASVHENARPVFPQHDIWLSRQSRMVQSVSETVTPQKTPHHHLWFGVLAMYGGHVFMSLLWRKFVHFLFKPMFFSKAKVTFYSLTPPVRLHLLEE